MRNETYEIVKGLQKLYCWFDFYKQTHQYKDLEKVNQEIKDYKTKYNIN